jgi:Arc/MetJ-type ribon-helix-helix transcriptional regulator
MKTLTVRLPEALVAQIEAESRERNVSKSDVVRERLTRAGRSQSQNPVRYEAIADLVGAIDDLPGDLSSNVKNYLNATGYGRKRPR